LRRGRPRIGLPEGVSHPLLATPLLELSLLLDLDPRLLLLQRAARAPGLDRLLLPLLALPIEGYVVREAADSTAQAGRIKRLNGLGTITREVVEAARECLVIGTG
jgi:hypothetical protein